MADEKPFDSPPIASDEIVKKVNAAISARIPLILSLPELGALATFVNKTIEQANEHAQMAHIISHRAYGQQSTMVH